MAENFRRRIVQHLTKNLLEFQILRLISSEPLWGYKIKRHIEKASELKVRHGTLYPLLNKLEREGLAQSQKQQYGKRKRKVYSITEKGKQYLQVYYDILKEQIPTGNKIN
jgi:DNA-binding PadR family transcriptional regulator